KDKDEQLKAHAWVRCGNIIVTGKKGMTKFTVVGTFT
ncbi:MAG: lasso peptide biosynthesis protein, partial [Bacteroidales bacterium]|nr:lasso peptide biosynthesis protein [Bacteroidales bacterium]